MNKTKEFISDLVQEGKVFKTDESKLRGRKVFIGVIDLDSLADSIDRFNFQSALNSMSHAAELKVFAPEPERWEYITLHNESQIIDAGKDSWELVSVVAFSDGTLRFFMKRPLIMEPKKEAMDSSDMSLH